MIYIMLFYIVEIVVGNFVFVYDYRNFGYLLCLSVFCFKWWSVLMNVMVGSCLIENEFYVRFLVVFCSFDFRRGVFDICFYFVCFII